MKRGKVNWNDSIFQFVKMKLQRPELLQDLVRREREYAHRKATEHKIEGLRGRYEELSLKFQVQQGDNESRLEVKRQIQRDVIKIMNSIKKTEVDLEKITQEPLVLPFRYSGKDYKEEPTRYSTDSDEFAMKRHQEEFVSMMADQGALKEAMVQEVEQLVAKRVQLTEHLESATVKLQQLIRKKQVRDVYQSKNYILEETKGRVEMEQLKRKKMMYKLADAEQRISEVKSNRKSYELDVQRSSKKIQGFGKECKKMLMSDQERTSQKYKEFIRKYRSYSPQEEAGFRTTMNYSRESSEEFSCSSPLSPSKNGEKYEDLAAQVMKKFSSKQYSPSEFRELKNRCVKITMYYESLGEENGSLNEQVENLQQNLTRKTRELQEVKRNPLFKNRFR